ncbi:MAG: hypothetical protein BWY68_00253 [bacterium ADurb.Bin400]|nr:MAG: hypothetical protein BWY68_00253 [bacterium ADurb.Bin400]
MLDKTRNKETGNLGEDAAVRFLQSRGYRILGRNLNFSCGEIDVLAEDHRVIVIVEVKTVRGAAFGPAQELVRRRKQEKLRQLASLIGQQHPNSSLRIDVVAVDYSTSPPAIELIQNAVN